MSIDISDFETIINSHMDRQPYGISCSVCGYDINITKNIDKDYDITIDAEPCEDCLEKAKLEGHKEGRDAGYEQCQKDHDIG